MEFSRQGYWSGLPCPTPGDLPNPESEPSSLASADLTGGFLTTKATWEAPILIILRFTLMHKSQNSSQTIVKDLKDIQ